MSGGKEGVIINKKKDTILRWPDKRVEEEKGKRGRVRWRKQAGESETRGDSVKGGEK